MYKNEHIFEFYLKNNNKKDKKVSEDLSEASRKILSCILALGYNSEYQELEFDIEKVIKMIMFDNTRFNMLSTQESIAELLNELKENKTLESQIANKCLNFELTIASQEIRNNLEDLYKKYLTLAYTPRLSHHVNIDKNYLFEGYENVLDHIYGTLLLALGIQSEYKYCLDYKKLFSTLLLHETDEILLGDDLCKLKIHHGELPEKNKEAISSVLEKLRKEKEYISQIIDYKRRSDITMEYALLINQLEFIMQTKMYEVRGMYNRQGRFDKIYDATKENFYTIPCLRGVLEKTKKL